MHLFVHAFLYAALGASLGSECVRHLGGFLNLHTIRGRPRRTCHCRGLFVCLCVVMECDLRVFYCFFFALEHCEENRYILFCIRPVIVIVVFETL